MRLVSAKVEKFTADVTTHKMLRYNHCVIFPFKGIFVCSYKAKLTKKNSDNQWLFGLSFSNSTACFSFGEF